MRYFFQFLCTVLSFQWSLAQSADERWVGEVFYRDAWEYARLDCNGEGCTFNLPYVDGQVRFRVTGNPAAQGSWSAIRRVENWAFETTPKGDDLTGTLTVNGKEQPVLLMKQLPLDTLEKSRCVGFYKDANGMVTKVYENFGYLHVHSPYSEQIMSLKPVSGNRYWTVAGEYFAFENLYLLIFSF